MNFKKIASTSRPNSAHYYYETEKCIYSYKTSRDKTIYLSCIEKSCQCKGKIKNNTFIRTNKEKEAHNHSNHESKAKAEEKKEKLRNIIKTDSRPVRKIHSELQRSLARDFAADLEWRKNRCTLNRVRSRLRPSCSTATNLIDLLEDEESSVFKSFGMLRDLPFYQGSVSGHLVFANLIMVSHIPNECELYIDATFGITPFNCRQLLVMMSEINGIPRPFVYALMKSQTASDYASIFSFVQNGILGYDGKHFLIFKKSNVSKIFE